MTAGHCLSGSVHSAPSPAAHRVWRSVLHRTARLAVGPRDERNHRQFVRFRFAVESSAIIFTLRLIGFQLSQSELRAADRTSGRDLQPGESRNTLLSKCLMCRKCSCASCTSALLACTKAKYVNDMNSARTHARGGEARTRAPRRSVNRDACGPRDHRARVARFARVARASRAVSRAAGPHAWG